MAVHRLGEARQPRHHAVLMDANLACCVLAPRVAVHVAAEDQTDAVSSEILVNFDEFFGDLPWLLHPQSRMCPRARVGSRFRPNHCGLVEIKRLRSWPRIVSTNYKPHALHRPRALP